MTKNEALEIACRTVEGAQRRVANYQLRADSIVVRDAIASAIYDAYSRGRNEVTGECLQIIGGRVTECGREYDRSQELMYLYRGDEAALTRAIIEERFGRK